MAFSYVPSDGLNNASTYITTPVTEALARSQFMDLFNQVKDEINNDIIGIQIANVTNTVSLNANGWFKDKKTGLIIQWGHGIAVKSTNTSLALPLTFPNALLWTGCVAADIGLTNISMHISACTTSTLSVNNQNTNDYTAYWLAIGY